MLIIWSGPVLITLQVLTRAMFYYHLYGNCDTEQKLSCQALIAGQLVGRLHVGPNKSKLLYTMVP